MDLILASTLKSSLCNLVGIIRWTVLLQNLQSKCILRRKHVDAIQAAATATRKLQLLIDLFVDSDVNYMAFAHSLYETGQSLCYMLLDPIRPRYFPELARIIIEPGTNYGQKNRPCADYVFTCGHTTLQLRVTMSDVSIIKFERYGCSSMTLSCAQFHVLGSAFSAIEAVQPGEELVITSLGPDQTKFYTDGILFDPRDPLHLGLLSMSNPDVRNQPRADHDSLAIPLPSAGIYIMASRLSAELQERLEVVEQALCGVSSSLCKDLPDLQFLVADPDGSSRSIFRMTNVEYGAFKEMYGTLLSLLSIIKQLPAPELPVTPPRWFPTAQQERALSVCVECLALYANNFATKFNAPSCVGCRPGTKQQLPDQCIRHIHPTQMEQLEAALPDIHTALRTVAGHKKMRALVFSEVSSVDTPVLAEVFERFMSCGISIELIRISSLYFSCKRGPIKKRVFAETEDIVE